MIRYAKPDRLSDALELLAEGSWRILAGGTDVYPAQGSRPFRDNILDINGLAELRGLSADGGTVTIGARTTWTDIVRAGLPPAFDALREAAREVGSVQIQNVATVAGNLCNASPAADGAPPLLVLDAEVELASLAGRRTLLLSQFVLGNRRTARRPDELVTAIRVPASAAKGRSAFVKLGTRRYLVISIAMVAARLVVDDAGRIAQAAVAVGACSAVAQRLAGLETRLAGIPAADAPTLALKDALAELSPIDDVRGSADYRRDAARELVARALAEAAGAAPREGRAAA